MATPGDDPIMDPQDAERAPLASEVLSAFTVERWARIVASLDAAPDAEADILAANDLDAAGWEQIDAHWVDAQQRRLEGGDATLLDAGDDAYVARLEEERGPITAEDHARLVAALERGAIEAALVALEIPEAAVPTLERVWTRRCAADAALADAERRELDARREGPSTS